MLTIEKGFAIGYGHRCVAESADRLTITEGVTLIRGSNGCGKTTLLRTLAGVLAPVKGEVEGFKELRDHEQAAFLPDRLSFPDHLLPDDVLNPKHGLDEVGMKMAEALHLADCRVAELSHGNQAKLAVSWTVGHPAKLYLLDEPFNGMDEDSMKVFIEGCRCWRPGAAFLVVVHGLMWADQMGTVIAFTQVDGKALFRR